MAFKICTRHFWANAMAFAGFLNFIMNVNARCSYEQDLQLGQEYYIYNPQYPNNYNGYTSCTWQARSVAGTQIVISCDEISLPASQNCQADRLSVSLTGDRNFGNARNYCGKGYLSLISESNSLAVGLFAPYNSAGGRFICTITAIQGTNPTPPPPTACDCGWKDAVRITGGQPTGVNEYPSLAALIDVTQENVFCGGNIVSERYLLSAAHCVVGREPRSIGALVGDYNISSGDDTPYATLLRIESIILHPDFNDNSLANDIAILRTDRIIPISLAVGPVCLPFRFTNFNFEEQSVTAVGYGTEEFTGPRSDVPMKVELQVISVRECQRSYQEVTESQICTFAPGKDACQSDSGGPIVWMDRGTRRLQLLGLISKGLGCGTIRPGVNTRLTSYLGWIIASTPDANYCIK